MDSHINIVSRRNGELYQADCSYFKLFMSLFCKTSICRCLCFKEVETTVLNLDFGNFQIGLQECSTSRSISSLFDLLGKAVSG